MIKKRFDKQMKLQLDSLEKGLFSHKPEDPKTFAAGTVVKSKAGDYMRVVHNDGKGNMVLHHSTHKGDVHPKDMNWASSHHKHNPLMSGIDYQKSMNLGLYKVGHKPLTQRRITHEGKAYQWHETGYPGIDASAASMDDRHKLMHGLASPTMNRLNIGLESHPHHSHGNMVYNAVNHVMNGGGLEDFFNNYEHKLSDQGLER